MSSDPGAGDIFSKLRAKFRGDEDIDGQRKLNKILNKLHEQKEISDREFSMMEGILEFEEKMARLTSELSDLFKQSHKLEAEIKEKLGAIGYEI